MRDLNTNELAQISGGISSKAAAAMGAIGGLAVLGAQRIAIDALKPICSSIIDVNCFSTFIGSGFGTPEHISHIITHTIGVATVGGLALIAAEY